MNTEGNAALHLNEHFSKGNMEENAPSTLLNHEHEDNKLNYPTIDTLNQEVSEDQCANTPIDITDEDKLNDPTTDTLHQDYCTNTPMDITDLNPVGSVSSASPSEEKENPSPKSGTLQGNKLDDIPGVAGDQEASAEKENSSLKSGPVKGNKLDDIPSVAGDQEVSDNQSTFVPIDTPETSRETPVSADQSTVVHIDTTETSPETPVSVAGSRRRFSRHESLQSIKVLSTNETTSPTSRKEKSMVCKNCKIM